MPSGRPRTVTNRILCDYLMAALRCSPIPLSTSELRRGAPAVAVAGSSRALPPTQETIYRLLRTLHVQGAVTVEQRDSVRVWSVDADPAAAREIALLDALFDTPAATTEARRGAPRGEGPCRPR